MSSMVISMIEEVSNLNGPLRYQYQYIVLGNNCQLQIIKKYVKFVTTFSNYWGAIKSHGPQCYALKNLPHS